MTGKELKLSVESQRLQRKAEKVIIDFLDRHLSSGLIFDDIKSTQCLLFDIYPRISQEESEADELLISAYIAGALHMLINSTSDTGIRWIYSIQPEDEEDETGDKCE